MQEGPVISIRATCFGCKHYSSEYQCEALDQSIYKDTCQFVDREFTNLEARSGTPGWCPFIRQSLNKEVKQFSKIIDKPDLDHSGLRDIGYDAELLAAIKDLIPK